MEPSFSEEDRRDAQLEAIFRTHVADLYRYIYQQVHHAVIAEDLTSAVFLKALRWLQQGRSPESVKGWLYTTARSIIADYWGEHTQIEFLPLEAVEEMPLLSDESDEQMRPLQARIQHLLDGLSSRERDILTLRFFQGVQCSRNRPGLRAERGARARLTVARPAPGGLARGRGKEYSREITRHAIR
jgi:RNA polymerase sigma factor (sigma-70 family)